MFKIPIYRDIDQPLFKHLTFHAEIGPFGDDSPNPIPIKISAAISKRFVATVGGIH